MARFRDLVAAAFRSAVRPGRGAAREDADSPGRTGPSATTVATRVGRIRMSYSPDPDDDPDPGEIVWTWVPYQENDGRGKDRPVLVVAREEGGSLLAVALSSRDHDGDVAWLPLGSGPWDGQGRPSWAALDRVLRVQPDGMRREGATLDRERFDDVAARLRERHGWH